jgi:hypothetical protein
MMREANHLKSIKKLKIAESDLAVMMLSYEVRTQPNYSESIFYSILNIFEKQTALNRLRDAYER